MRCSWAPSLVLILASACDDSLNVGSAELEIADDAGVQGAPDATIERIDQIAAELKGEWVAPYVAPLGGVLTLSLTPTSARGGDLVLRCTNAQGRPCNDNAPGAGSGRDGGLFGDLPAVRFLDQVFNADRFDGTYWVHTASGSKSRGVLLFGGFGLEFEYDAAREVITWIGPSFTRVASNGAAPKPP